MDKDKQKTKSEEGGIGGLLLLGAAVGAVAWGAIAYERRREEEAAARRWLEAQREQEQARRMEAFKEELRGHYEQRLAAVREQLQAEAAERERKARESAAREAKAAEERRDHHYRKREEGRDRRFDAHEEGRSRIASDHVAQQSRVFERWFAERDAELEPLRAHGDFLRDLAQPTRPAAPTAVPVADDPEMAAVYAELSRFGKGSLDG